MESQNHQLPERRALPLLSSTPETWLSAVFADFDSFLIDHADCERKASASALSLVIRFADRKFLIEPMITLAKEELQHFHEVFRLLAKRGLQVKSNSQDQYVKLLSSQIRHGDADYFMDRLLVASIIEARSCERFRLVADAVVEADLQKFYRRLAHEEAAHHTIFLKILNKYFPEEEVNFRMQQLLVFEATAISQVSIRAAMH